MKKSIFKITVVVFALFVLFFKFWIINNPQPDECKIVTATIVNITEGSTFDIVFKDQQDDRYYINRGLEQDLNLDSLNAYVLNKTVTLHLPKLLGGLITSEHIAQLAIGDDIFFTEFD